MSSPIPSMRASSERSTAPCTEVFALASARALTTARACATRSRGSGYIAHVEQHHVADEIPQVGAWMGVVADKGDALRPHIVVKNCQHFVAHVGRHPGIDAVRDDVIERAIVRRNVCDTGMAQRNVLQTKRGDGADPSSMLRPLRSIPTNSLSGY